ncbi:hypothetical protein LTS18_004057 [Coniosporium uncinatum]|uniref:Uncharacterized protein n=1 Tax=Coniosporium uncinatum TaxID=93489 RepID=A0ACC3D6E2_9PEZI|nr:hypothetical protein LTS18_004057 [Coniosporium uncinatum]
MANFSFSEADFPALPDISVPMEAKPPQPSTAKARKQEARALLLRAVNDTIGNIPLTSLQIYLNPVRVHASRGVGLHTDCRLERYFDFITHTHRKRRVLVRLSVPDEDDNREPEVVLGEKGTTVQLSKWVHEWITSHLATEDAVTSDTGCSGYNQQWNWWQCCKKPFDFQSLSGELRNQVYGYLLGPSIDVCASGYSRDWCWDVERIITGRDDKGCMDNTRSPGGMAFSRQRSERYAEYGSPSVLLDYTVHRRSPSDTPVMAVLFLNRQIREEALSLGWQNSQLVLTHVNQIRAFATWFPRSGYEQLQSLRLDLRNNQLLSFFGADLPGIYDSYVPEETFGSARVLQTIPQLKHLVLHVDSPMAAAEYDPWKNEFKHHYRWWADLPATSCHRILIDWALAFAFEYIKDIPKIELIGYIKTSIRIKWEQRLAEYKAGKEVDVVGEIDAIKKLPEQFL